MENTQFNNENQKDAHMHNIIEIHNAILRE